MSSEAGISAQPNHNELNQHDPSSFISLLLPPSALPFIIILLLLLPMIILAGENLMLPLIAAIKSIILPEMKGMRTVLPFHFFIKLGLFLAFIAVLLSQLLLRIRQAYIQAWASHFPRPDRLHVPYYSDPVESVSATLQWWGYRVLVIFSLPTVLVLTTGAFGLFAFSLMNQVMDLSTISLPAAITIFLFLGLMLGLFTVLSVGNSIWLFFTTLFGDMAALTESDLLPKVIFERCRRVAFASPWVWLIYALNIVFGVLVIACTGWLMWFYNIQDLTTLRLPFFQIMLSEVGLLVFYIVLSYLTWFTYHDSLRRYYESLPPAFRNRFSQPD